MIYSNEQVFDALRHVTHPESGNNIATLGMVEDVKVEGKNISFTLFFNRANDPFVASLQKACVKAIEKYLSADVQVNISLRFNEVPQAEKPLANVKNIIAISSGKGGVGKSTVAANLAIGVAKTGARVGLIDADIFGPSVPLMFGAQDYKPTMTEVDGKSLIEPLQKYGVKALSIGFFVDAANALVWRGPMAANALKQLLFDTDWGMLDFLFIDLPPGTSDIHLSIVQELSVTGAIIVSTPQKVALADVVKGINMFKSDKVNVPILGLVENMAWFTPAELPENKYYIFGKDGCKQLAEEFDTVVLGQIPLVQSICESGDSGIPAVLDSNTIVGKAFDELSARTIEAVEYRNQTLPTTQKVQMQKNAKH
jgi:ATP-binding protein involved in chromosome partitioning